MGFLDKFKSKSDKNKFKEQKEAKSSKDLDIKKRQDESDKSKNLTIAELKDKNEQSKVDSNKLKSTTEKKVAKKVAKDDTKMAYAVLYKPMITEKGTYLASENKYIFEVALKTNKIEIKKAINAVYGVWPIAVNIVKLPGKKVRYGKVQGKTKSRKKAIVTLKKGDTINVYEGV